MIDRLREACVWVLVGVPVCLAFLCGVVLVLAYVLALIAVPAGLGWLLYRLAETLPEILKGVIT